MKQKISMKEHKEAMKYMDEAFNARTEALITADDCQTEVFKCICKAIASTKDKKVLTYLRDALSEIKSNIFMQKLYQDNVWDEFAEAAVWLEQNKVVKL